MAFNSDRAAPDTTTVSRVSWGAVFAGTAIAVVVQTTLVLLGMAIGFYTLNFATEENPWSGLGVGSYLWWIVSMIIALFIGGWVTSRFAGLQRKYDGALHGAVTWGVATIFTIVLLTNALGTVVGGAFGVVRNVVSFAGQAVTSAIPNISLPSGAAGDVIDEAQQVMRTIRERGGDDAVTELTTAIRDIFRDPEVTRSEQQRIVGLLVEYTEMSEQEASSTVDRWETVYQDARQQIAQAGGQLGAGAEETAGDVADALGTAAIWSFVAMILGLLAAAGGGMVGRVKGNVKV